MLTKPIITAEINEANSILILKYIAPNLISPPIALRTPMLRSVLFGTLNNMANPTPAIPAATLLEIIRRTSMLKIE
jgi:hypothetical protein